MEINILTYNVNGKNLNNTVCEIVAEHNIDLIFLIEPDSKPENLLLRLNKLSPDFYFNSDSCRHVNVFSKFTAPQFVNVESFDRTTCWELNTPLDSFAFIATHYFDKFYNDPKAQKTKLRHLLNEINLIEKQLKTEKVILTGDLNMDPYDEICYLSTGLNSIMCRHTVLKLRINEGQKMFYNPSWSLLGDRINTPGTYFRKAEGSQFWSVLDQVMMRPDVIKNYDLNSLKIINKTTENSLLTKNNRPSGKFSDHLPITFKINI